MRFYQTFVVAALAGLVAASPVPFTEDSLAVRSNDVADAITAPLTEKREPVPAKAKKGKAKAKAKAKAKGKKGKKRDVEDLVEREAEPVDASNVDTIVVARTPDAEAEPELEDIVERSPAKAKKGKGKAKAKGKKGKKRDVEDLVEREAVPEANDVVLARTPGAEPEPEFDDIVERSPAKAKKGKGKKGKGKAKAKKGKKRSL